MMRTEEGLWIVMFVILFLAINFLQFLVNNALSDKPPGSQTVYDLALRDLFIWVKFEFEIN